MVFFLDAVAAVHVAGGAGDVERLAAIVALDERDQLGRGPALVEQTTDTKRRLQAESNLSLHVGELLLHELSRRERPAKLFALEDVSSRPEPAILGSPHGTPGNAVAGAVQATERTFQAGDVGKQRRFCDLDAVHHDLAGDRGAERQFSADL